MDATLFEDLVQSLKEAKAIAKGEAPASRRFQVKPIDVKGKIGSNAAAIPLGHPLRYSKLYPPPLKWH